MSSAVSLAPHGLWRPLALGETGVGKEVIAEAIHRASPRRARPMIRAHCAAIPLTLIERDQHPKKPDGELGIQGGNVWHCRICPCDSMRPQATLDLVAAPYAWGDEFLPGDRHFANTWQGQFPWQNLGTDGYEFTSPVGAFPPNGYGLYDVIGNVWEWTTDWYQPKHPAEVLKACCVPHNPLGPKAEDSYDPSQPEIKIPRKVIKGGSHLCAPNYCRQYRPAARFPEPIDTSTSHLGFRCGIRPTPAQR